VRLAATRANITGKDNKSRALFIETTEFGIEAGKKRAERVS